MSNDKPLTLEQARSRAETMAKIAEGRLKDFPRNIDAGQWRVDSQMLRLLLAASATNPEIQPATASPTDDDIAAAYNELARQGVVHDRWDLRSEHDRAGFIGLVRRFAGLVKP
jgi:hypothetical protein